MTLIVKTTYLKVNFAGRNFCVLSLTAKINSKKNEEKSSIPQNLMKNLDM